MLVDFRSRIKYSTTIGIGAVVGSGMDGIYHITVAVNANWNSVNDDWNLNANEFDSWNEDNLVFARCTIFLPL